MLAKLSIESLLTMQVNSSNIQNDVSAENYATLNWMTFAYVYRKWLLYYICNIEAVDVSVLVFTIYFR